MDIKRQTILGVSEQLGRREVPYNVNAGTRPALLTSNRNKTTECGKRLCHHRKPETTAVWPFVT